MSLEVADSVFRAAMTKLRGRGRSPPNSLVYFDQQIANVLAAKSQPMPQGNPHDDPLAIPSRFQRGASKTDRAKAAIMRAAIAGGYAPVESEGEAGSGDDPLPVLPVLAPLRERA